MAHFRLGVLPDEGAPVAVTDALDRFAGAHRSNLPSLDLSAILLPGWEDHNLGVLELTASQCNGAASRLEAGKPALLLCTVDEANDLTVLFEPVGALGRLTLLEHRGAIDTSTFGVDFEVGLTGPGIERVLSSDLALLWAKARVLHRLDLPLTELVASLRQEARTALDVCRAFGEWSR